MTETTVPVKTRTRVRRLTATQKVEAITLWKSGTVTLDDLAAKFKKDRTTFVRLFKDEGIERGTLEAETKKKVEAAVEAAIVDDATILAKRIKDVKEEHFRYVDGISKLTWQVIVIARQEKRTPATFATDMKSLELAMRVFKMGREEKYKLLGINPDDDNDDKPLPVLEVRELNAEDIKRLHEQSLMADDELGLNELLGDEELVDGGSLEDENERVESD